MKVINVIVFLVLMSMFCPSFSQVQVNAKCPEISKVRYDTSKEWNWDVHDSEGWYLASAYEDPKPPITGIEEITTGYDSMRCSYTTANGGTINVELGAEGCKFINYPSEEWRCPTTSPDDCEAICQEEEGIK